VVAKLEKPLEEKGRSDFLPFMLILLLGAVLLLVANTHGAGDSRWRYLLYFSLVALLSLAVFSAFRAGQRTRLGRPFRLALGLFAALILLSALSFLWGSDLYNGIHGLLLLGSYALAFALAYLLIRGEGRAWLFMGTLTVVSVSLCAYGLIQYFINFSDFVAYLALRGVGFEFSDRVFSQFINPNVFASFLNLTAPLALALVLVERRRALSWVWGGALLLQLWCLYLTQSRGGWISFAVMLVLLLLLVPRSTWRKRWRLLAVIFLLAAVVIALSSLYNPLQRGIEGVERWEYSGLDVAAAAGSLRGRMGIWRGGLDMFFHNLAGGVGIGDFGTAMQRYQYRAYYSAHAHNYLLETGAEIGVFGLLLLLGLTLLVLGRVRPYYGKVADHGGGIAVAVLWVAAVGFFLHNLVDFSWFNPLVGVTFWLCAGALFAMTEKGPDGEEAGEEAEAEGEEREPSPRGKRPALSGFVLAAVLSVAVLSCGYLMANYFLAETHRDRGSELADAGEETEAVEELLRSLDYVETNPNVHKVLGDLYSNLYDQSLGGVSGLPPAKESAEKGLAHYNRAIELGPEDAYKYQARGLLLIAMGYYPEARRSLEEAQRLYPHNPASFYFEGRSFSEQGMQEEAKAKYRETLALLPFYADPSIVPFREREGLDMIIDALSRLAEIMVSEGDAEGALEQVERAMRELPGDGRLYAIRGRVYEESGETEKALEDYRTALELEPGLVGVHLALGRIYKQAGDYERAAAEFELELEVNPFSDEARRELESLTGGG